MTEDERSPRIAEPAPDGLLRGLLVGTLLTLVMTVVALVTVLKY